MIRFSPLTRKRKVVLFVGGFAASLIAAYLLGSCSIYHPVTFNEPAMNRAAQWVQTHKVPARFGAVTLPPQFAPLSITGKAYVSDGIVFFPSWRGRKTLFPDLLNSERNDIEGYGFSDKPLPTMESEPEGSDRFFAF